MLDIFSFTYINTDFFRATVSFLFIFALIFGILQITKRKIKTIDGNYREERLFPERVNVLLALTIALISITYKPLINFVWTTLPIASTIFIILFFVAFIREILKSEEKNPIPFLVSIGILILILGTLEEFINLSASLPFPISQRDILWIIGIVFVVLLFYFGYISGRGERKQSK